MPRRTLAYSRRTFIAKSFTYYYNNYYYYEYILHTYWHDWSQSVKNLEQYPTHFKWEITKIQINTNLKKSNTELMSNAKVCCEECWHPKLCTLKTGILYRRIRWDSIRLAKPSPHLPLQIDTVNLHINSLVLLLRQMCFRKSKQFAKWHWIKIVIYFSSFFSLIYLVRRYANEKH